MSNRKPRKFTNYLIELLSYDTDCWGNELGEREKIKYKEILDSQIAQQSRVNKMRELCPSGGDCDCINQCLEIKKGIEIEK